MANHAIVLSALAAASRYAFSVNEHEKSLQIIDDLINSADPEIVSNLIEIRSVISFCALSTMREVHRCDRVSGENAKIYFLQNGSGLIKIGFADDVEKRVAQIQPMAGENLSVLCVIDGGRKIETELHKRFSEFRHFGEWFKPSQEIMDFISEAKVSGGAE